MLEPLDDFAEGWAISWAGLPAGVDQRRQSRHLWRDLVDVGEWQTLVHHNDGSDDLKVVNDMTSLQVIYFVEFGCAAWLSLFEMLAYMT